MSVIQQTLPFATSTREQNRNTDLDNFLKGLPNKYIKQRAACNVEPKKVEAWFPSRKESFYNASGRNKVIVGFLHVARIYFESIKNCLAYKDPIILEEGLILYPNYMSVSQDAQNGIDIDTAITIYYSENGLNKQGKSGRRSDTVYLRLYINLHFRHLKGENRHVIDRENSSIYVHSPLSLYDSKTISTNGIEHHAYDIFFPWRSILNFTTGSVWERDLRKAFSEFLKDKLNIKSAISSGQADLQLEIDRPSYSYNRLSLRYLKLEEALIEESLVSKDTKDIFKNFIMNRCYAELFPKLRPSTKVSSSVLRNSNSFDSNILEDQKTYSLADYIKVLKDRGEYVDLTIYPYFYKYFMKLTEGRILTDNIRAPLGATAFICHYYEDPGFLDHLSPDALARFTCTPSAKHSNYTTRLDSSTAHSTYSLDIEQLRALIGNSFFNSLERHKQYRILASIIESDQGAVMHLPDAIRMIRAIEAKEINLRTKISTRRVKDIQSLHDEVVYVYNEIKYPKVEIDYKSHYAPLISYGLNIENTDLEIVIPEHSNVIRAWGQEQSHCIATYINSCVEGQKLLFGVKNKHTGNWEGHVQTNASFSEIVSKIKGKYFTEKKTAKLTTEAVDSLPEALRYLADTVITLPHDLNFKDHMLDNHGRWIRIFDHEHDENQALVRVVHHKTPEEKEMEERQEASGNQSFNMVLDFNRPEPTVIHLADERDHAYKGTPIGIAFDPKAFDLETKDNTEKRILDSIKEDFSNINLISASSFMKSWIYQFYGKRNVAVNDQVKSCVYEHIYKALYAHVISQLEENIQTS